MPPVPEIQLVLFFCGPCKHVQNWTTTLLQTLFFCAISGKSSQCPASQHCNAIHTGLTVPLLSPQITNSREPLHQPLSIGPGYSVAIEMAGSRRGFRLGPGRGLGAVSASIPSIREHQLSLPHLAGGCFSSSHLPKSTRKQSES